MLGDIPKTEASSSDDFQVLLSWADKHRRLKIRTNADTPEDARRARELGAEGIGLCRTEHMFFEADRIRQMRAMILAESPEERAEALDKLFHFQHDDMLAIYQEMDGLPVTIRLLDPPLHEFCTNTPADIELMADNVGKSVEKIEAIIENLEK